MAGVCQAIPPGLFFYLCLLYLYFAKKFHPLFKDSADSSSSSPLTDRRQSAVWYDGDEESSDCRSRKKSFPHVSILAFQTEKSHRVREMQEPCTRAQPIIQEGEKEQQ